MCLTWSEYIRLIAQSFPHHLTIPNRMVSGSNYYHNVCNSVQSDMEDESRKCKGKGRHMWGLGLEVVVYIWITETVMRLILRSHSRVCCGCSLVSVPKTCSNWGKLSSLCESGIKLSNKQLGIRLPINHISYTSQKWELCTLGTFFKYRTRATFYFIHIHWFPFPPPFFL